MNPEALSTHVIKNDLLFQVFSSYAEELIDVVSTRGEPLLQDSEIRQVLCPMKDFIQKLRNCCFDSQF